MHQIHWWRYCHVEKRWNDNWLNKVRNLEVSGVSRCGRPGKTWEHIITEDLGVKGLNHKLKNDDIDDNDNDDIKSLFKLTDISTVISGQHDSTKSFEVLGATPDQTV